MPAPSADVHCPTRSEVRASAIFASKGLSSPERNCLASRVNVAPRGHIGLHSHDDDPTVVYVVSGVLTNHRDDGTTNEVRAGEAFAEFGPKSHWVENAGSTPAIFVFASVSRRQ